MELRLEALKLATEVCNTPNPDLVLNTAKRFLAFLNGEEEKPASVVVPSNWQVIS